MLDRENKSYLISLSFLISLLAGLCMDILITCSLLLGVEGLSLPVLDTIVTTKVESIISTVRLTTNCDPSTKTIG